MSTQPESREEAVARLNRSASELEARTTSDKTADAVAQAVAGKAYRIVAELIGGVLVGLGLGFVIDLLVGSSPWGLIGGTLFGFAVSIWMAWRTTKRLQAEADAAGVVPKSIPFDDEDEER
ncbi:MAG: AtpZ/AtpI family protein [Brevundimonas sp.]|uniref:AtpZ/AtpI family protein n=1 Tax=Brevundimonas sp. TaxID=1871086 RepID=UPI001A1AD95B|nr:AtpZ/AtpI family protein [Brevundimonas sp.]MBJ7446574.1 AtpZ/AtpI family protein [Brevundimonas sp.]